MTPFETRPLERVATLSSGGTPSKANPAFWTGDVPWLTPKDMGRWTGKTEETVATAAIGSGTRLAPARASYVAVRGMSLHNEIRVIHSPIALTFNQDIKAVVANDGIEPRFLYFALAAAKPQLLDWVSAAGHGTGVLATDRLKSIQIPVPSIAVQRAIACLLGDLDDKIELNRRMNETLEAMALAIFRDWFVDFGPVRRKLAGATDPVEITGGLTSDPDRAAELAAIFPDALGDDGLPSGWSERPIGDLVEIAGGSTPSTADEYLWQPAEHRWATPKDLSNMSDLALFDTGRRISSAGLAKITSGLLPAGTVLLSSRAPIGYLAIAQAPVAINQGFIALKPTGNLGSAYLYLWCKANMEAILANANGSTFQEISKKNFRPITSAAPDDEVACRTFGEIVEPMIARIVSAAAESLTLTETRDYLLPRLMSGAVRVGEIAQSETD